MKLVNLLLAVLLIAPPLAHADLVELVRIYGPSGGGEFYHVCGPGDVNQDGYDDFIISSPVRDRRRHECENGYARLYFGGNPIDTSNYIMIPAVCNPDQHGDYGFGRYCTKVGHVNGDDYPDFLIGDPEYDYNYYGPWNSGAGFIYWGGPVVDTLPGLRLIGDTFNAWSLFYGLGDVNGDAYNDIVASMRWCTKLGGDPYMVDIYLGGESPDSIPDFEIWPFFGQYPVVAEPAKIVGDYNGDGKDDIVFCNSGYELGSSYGIAYMFFGSESGFNQPDLMFQEQCLWEFGTGLSGCGDLNCDGFDEFMVAGHGALFIYYGSQNPDTIPDLIIKRETYEFPDYLSARGDLNRDGYADIAVSYSWWSEVAIQAGQVLIYYGGEEMDTIPDIVICGEDRSQRLGREIAFPGDINGDGYPEFIASSEYYEDPGRSCVTIYTTNTTPVSGSDPLLLVREIELRCYPNPFNVSTLIEYSLPEATAVKVAVFDLLGREVIMLENSRKSRGEYQVAWDGRDSKGKEVSTGIYFVLLDALHTARTHKVVLLK